MRELSNEYIAGLVDGEGYIGLTKHTQKNGGYRLGMNFIPTVQIVITGEQARVVIRKIHQKFGGTNC